MADSEWDDWLDEAPVPEAIEKIWPGSVPTTDQMDHTTPEERYKLVVLCADCNDWHHFTGSADRFGQTEGEQCQCGSKRFVGGSLISERTWNPANKKKAKR